MRKVLSFVLVLSLVLGSLGMAFAAPMSDVKGEDFEDAVNVLVELGVVTGYPDGTYRPDNIVTRAEMAVITVKMLGLDQYASGTSGFKDMAGHWSNKYVAYATSLGIIDGYPDGTFRPDKTVSYDEAAKMLVAMLGYTPEALVGSWPANYVTKAKSLGILDGVVAGSTGANRGDIATMAFQTLDATIGKVDNDGFWNPILLGMDTSVTPALPIYETILDRLGAELFDPDGVGPLDPGDPFVLTDELAEEAIANVREYVGAYVTAYASDDKILAVKDVKSVFLTGSKTAGGKFKAGGVEYTFSNKADFITNTAIAIEFTNGETDNTPVSIGGINTVDTLTLAVDLSSKTIHEVYSVMDWDISKAGFFDEDEADAIKDDHELFGVEFAEDDSRDIDLTSFALLGVNSLEDLEEDYVVYVYEGINSKTITRIEVGTEIVEGVVTKVSGKKFTVGGTAYEYNNDVNADFTQDDFAVKDEVILHLDYAGDIANGEIVSGAVDKYGIVLGVGISEQTLLTGPSKVKLFLADGTVSTLDLDTDEFNKATAEAILTAVSRGGVVQYDLNSDGEVTSLTFAAISHKVLAGDDFKSGGTYDGKNVASDVVIFTSTTFSATATTVTALTTDKDDLGVMSYKDMLGLKDVVAAYYYDIDDSKKITFMIIQEDSATKDDEVYGVLNKDKGGTLQADPGYFVNLVANGDLKLVDGEVASTKADYTPAATTGTGLLLIKFNKDGFVSNLVDAKTDADGYIVVTMAGITGVSLSVAKGVATVTVSTGGVEVGAGGTFDYGEKGIDWVAGDGGATSKAAITLSKDLVVFTWSADKKAFVKSSKLDGFVEKDWKVYFYDVYGDGDGIADIVVVDKK